MANIEPRINRFIIYILRNTHQKAYVVNFRTQISSSQSEERTMFFHVWEKWYVQSEATEVSEFRAKIPAFIAACSAASHTFSEKSFTQRVFLARKVKNISGMEWNSFVCFTVDEKTVESRRNNNGKGKTERDVSFCCAFCRSYFAFHLSLSLYWNRPFYLNSLSFNCALRANSYDHL